MERFHLNRGGIVETMETGRSRTGPRGNHSYLPRASLIDLIDADFGGSLILAVFRGNDD